MPLCITVGQKSFLEVGKKRLAGDTVREATTDEVRGFVSYLKHKRYHESLDNLTPADIFYAQGNRILEQRAFIKQNTLAMRKQMHSANQTRSLTSRAKPCLKSDSQTPNCFRRLKL
jgi:hypothetical protein